MLVIIILVFVIIAFFTKRLNLRINKLMIIVGLLILLFLTTTYGHWEIKTLLYNDEFRPFVEKYQSQSNSLMSPGIDKLKIFSYSNNESCVFVKDKEGNKWLLYFQKNENNHQWDTYFNDRNHIEIIHSVRGGSANQMFYWY